MGRTISSEGVILARRDWGEADRILVVYTREFGKGGFIAKGVRRPNSRKRGHIEIFSRVKFSAVYGRGIGVMTEAEVIDGFPGVRKNLRSVSVGYYFMEVMGKITREGERNEQLYELLLKYLRDLGRMRQNAELVRLRKSFVYDVLVLLGFWPDKVKMDNPDMVLNEVIEREMNSVRVGKRVLS